MTRMEWARCAVGYVSKYVSKGQKDAVLPKGARMYGVGGLKGEALNEARWWALPGWLREEIKEEDEIIPQRQIKRCVGGGWLDPESGEFFASPWRVIFRGFAVWAYRIDRITPEEAQRLIADQGGGNAALVAK
jgi:hypothetical protein